jgi:hypothetical protein
MLAHPYVPTTPSPTGATKGAPGGPPENDAAPTPKAAAERAAPRPPEPHWDAVIAAATD